MKRLSLYFIVAITLFSCFEKVDPEVDTIRMSNKKYSIVYLKDIGIKELYNHYSSGNKDKQYYEVISKYARFIVNYNRIDERLTFCTDPGSGWTRQFQNIKEEDLKEMVERNITLNDFDFDPELVKEILVVVNDTTMILRGKELISTTSGTFIQELTGVLASNLVF